MSKRRPNPRLVKIHRNYTVEEVAALFGIHRNTVREWVKRGLPTIDDRRPMLIFGHELVTFVRARRSKNKRSCKPGEIYCVKCREPRSPAGGTVEYRPGEEGLGSLIGRCRVCDCVMYRRVNGAKLELVRGELEVTSSQASAHIGDSNCPSPNSDFKQE